MSLRSNKKECKHTMVNTNTNTAAADPHQKFKDITDLMLVKAQERGASLQDRLTFAWADHVRKTENTDNHGKGLGEAMYTSARDYIVKDMYGITGDLPGNEEFKTEVENIISTTMGLEKNELAKVYSDKKVVHVGDLDQIVEISQKAMGKKMNQIQVGRLKALPETDLDAFKAYLAAQAGEMKVSFDPAKVPTMSAAINQYMQMFPLMAQYRGLGEKAKAYKQTAEE